ncbi:NmrA family NAD(P)-binding protein [Alkalihalophilus lindianensis]|uniref:NmrA family NAD(P)-binding protein n=1 Tax=Alkalihalophilus lindianensis TaxID=1630542 RepID=A0ABU3X960_9BACI|nr:NmrA family NAD(P)-binding protein [Alkalihalophilus lindianensis]MDV2684413.1 NmrA family NAD(P)-binding protein [Alkalihalophilus lindianensis]
MLLVTGITGHTGKYFLKELINNKYQGVIRCVVRETSDTSLLDNSGLNIEKVVGNLNDKSFVEQIMPGVEAIMHIYNIHHSPVIVETAIKNKVKRAILVHTTGIYSNFKYASQEYKNVEQKVFELTKQKECPTKVTILRPTMIYGDICDSNMSKFIKMVDKLRVIPVINKGESLLQPVNARDLGKAFFNVLLSPTETSGKVYDLSGEKPIKMIEVFRIISKEFNRQTTFVSVPLSLGELLAKSIKIITLGRINYVEKVQRMGEDRSYSHINARNDFGYNPMSLEEGIRIEVKEYLEAKDIR